MAFTSVAPLRAYSIGPVKQAVYTFTTVSGDTTGSISATHMALIDLVSVTGGIVLAAAPTINNAVTPPTITLSFAASPTAGNFGTVIVHGK